MSAPYRHPNYQAHSSGSAGTNDGGWRKHRAHTDQVQSQPYYGSYSPHHSYNGYDADRGDAYAAYDRAYHRVDDHALHSAEYYNGDAYARPWQGEYRYSRDRSHDHADGRRGGSGGFWTYNRQYQPQSYPYYEGRGPQQQQSSYGYGPPHGPDGVWAAASNAVRSVQAPPSAPAAPRKMRQATAASDPAQGADVHPAPSNQWGAEGYYAQQPIRHSNGAYPSLGPASYHQQQQEYPTSQPASRYQPYNRAYTPNGPPAPRPPPIPRLPQVIRAAPRPEYLEKAAQEPKQLTEEEATERKLLVVLDLNGTLVFRAKSGNGRALDSVRAVPRPFLACFLQYCLGLPNSSSEDSVASTGKQVDASDRPHGSHFWQTVAQSADNNGATADSAPAYEPRSNGKAEVVVWSSAQPVNVDSMVRASFDEAVRSRLLRVWARDTLVPVRFYQLKAESTKDLEIVWAELNAFANNQPSPGRLLAEARDRMDQARPDDAPRAAVSAAPTAPAAMNGGKKYKKAPKKSKKALRREQREREAKEAQEQDGSEAEAEPVSAALEAATRAEELGPWGMENTVLVDDSVAKARLQPYNHLLIPEFGKEEAVLMRKFIRQQLALADTAQQDGEGDGGLEYDSDLSIGNEARSEPSTAQRQDTAVTNDDEENKGSAEGTTRIKKKPVPESRLDDVLLQTIGVLETLRYQANVGAFIHSGGIRGYGSPKRALNEEEKREQIQQGQTPEYWAERGRETCVQLGIEVKAWLPSAAASATASLL